jgi:hypothetical protein
MIAALLRSLVSLGLVTAVSGCGQVWIPGDRPPTSRLAAFGAPAATNDAVARGILSGPTLPKTIFNVRQRLLGLGGHFHTHIVANRGHMNPEAGSFSWFETYSGPIPGGQVQEGELFIGFFSERQGDNLVVQQSFEPSLMIELIAWDYSKQMYNFWELIGNGKGSDWHFRGDSTDILNDGASINTGATHPQFGTKLRCSGCHTLGGPIMKELEGPHNDWWTVTRKLQLGSMKLVPGNDPQRPANVAANLFASATDASNLSMQVKKGIDRLIQARAQRGGDGQSLKQQLRSLFTPMEMNLVTDDVPYTERTGGMIHLPQDFFVDRRLVGDQPPIQLPAALYGQALASVGSRFAPDEANLPETYHAFVVPGRSYVDNRVIDSLIQCGILDEGLVTAILAVDFTTPVYSRKRYGLLKYVPDTARSAAELRAGLIANLKAAPQDPVAQELLANLTDPHRNAAFLKEQAIAYLKTCQSIAGMNGAVADWLQIASQRREELRHAETSSDPRGTITEPGFRVIFPVDHLNAQPGQLMLDPATGRAIGQ